MLNIICKFKFLCLYVNKVVSIRTQITWFFESTNYLPGNIVHLLDNFPFGLKSSFLKTGFLLELRIISLSFMNSQNFDIWHHLRESGQTKGTTENGKMLRACGVQAWNIIFLKYKTHHWLCRIEPHFEAFATCYFSDIDENRVSFLNFFIKVGKFLLI